MPARLFCEVLDGGDEVEVSRITDAVKNLICHKRVAPKTCGEQLAKDSVGHLPPPAVKSFPKRLVIFGRFVGLHSRPAWLGLPFFERYDILVFKFRGVAKVAAEPWRGWRTTRTRSINSVVARVTSCDSSAGNVQNEEPTDHAAFRCQNTHKMVFVYNLYHGLLH